MEPMVRGPYLLRLSTLLKDWSLSRAKTTPEKMEPGEAAEATSSFDRANRFCTARLPRRHELLVGFAVPQTRHEAAYKLIGNAEAVAKFACRGAGRGSGWNLLPGRAPLSDPNATPNLEILPDVDYCLRRVRLVLDIYFVKCQRSSPHCFFFSRLFGSLPWVGLVLAFADRALNQETSESIMCSDCVFLVQFDVAGSLCSPEGVS